LQALEQLYSDYKYDYPLSEELTQETFYQAFISIDKFQGRCQIKTWLCQIAKNTFYQYLRKKKREQTALVKLVGWCSGKYDEKGITVVPVQCFDEQVAYIEMGTNNRQRKEVKVG
jgi:RNA polymerase sigma factor (sigma-70 family)